MTSPDLDFNSLPDDKAERLIFTLINEWDTAVSLSHTQIGLMVRAVRDRQLWKHHPGCTSWTRWLRIAAPKAYSTCHQALKDITDLADVPEADLSAVRQENVETMKYLSTAVRNDPDVLEAAKTQRSDQFREAVREKYPEQHLSNRKAVKVMCDEPELVYSVLDQAVELHDATDRGVALEMIAEMARRTWELEGEVEMSIKHEVERG